MIRVLTVVTALGCGLMAGVFFAFSSFVMAGLRRLPAAHGTAAMQSINVTVINPVFMAALMGTAAACVVLAVSVPFRWDEPGAGLLLAGSALYLVGAIGVTGAANIPRNNALDALDPNGADTPSRWAAYVAEWTAWNHVRTVACLAAAASLTIAAMQ